MRRTRALSLGTLLALFACSAPPAPDPEAGPASIEHQPVLEATEGDAIELRAEILWSNESLAEAQAGVQLHFRTAGTDPYESSDMEASQDGFAGTIPSEAVSIIGVEYYLSLTGVDDAPTHPTNGAALPHRVVVSAAALQDPAPLRARYDAASDSVVLTWTAPESSAFVGYTVSATLPDEEPYTVCSGGDPDPGCTVATEGLFDQQYAQWRVDVVDDSGNGRSAEASTDGLHLTSEVWGKEPSTEGPANAGTGQGEFSLPFGIALTSSRIHVIEQGNHRLQTFDNEGLFQTFIGAASGAGVPGDGPGEFNAPHDIALGPEGEVYVADYSNARVQVFDGQSHQFSHDFGELGVAEGQLRFPTGLAFDPADSTLHVVESVNARISVFDPATGAFIESYDTIDGHLLEEPRRILWMEELGSMAIADGGNIYLASRRDGIEDDTWLITESETATVAGMCRNKWGETLVTIDDPANTVDSEGHRILKFDSEGDLLLELGEWGVLEGLFWRPVDCAVSELGEVYVADGLNHRVQIFGP